MDSIYGPPIDMPPNHWNFVVLVRHCYQFQQYIIANFGFSFWLIVEQFPEPFVLPIMTYGATWTLALYVLV
jgi:hypothetical protein